ncbi:MAG TPA: rRNA maturation RNase YbeY [Firmicutes bacterium]|nr:rRNA maturation RNase YbeY [Bacillota bacterium]
MKEKEKVNQLTFDDRTGLCPNLEELLSALFDYICKFQKIEKPCVESLTLADDDFVRDINHKYRGLDRTTDVISFALEEADDEIDPPVRDLGDLIVSLPQAQRQANEFKHPLAREIAFLVIHGTLHNLGYDHTRSEKDAEIMYSLQNNILNSFKADWEDSRWKPLQDPLKVEK